MVAQVEKCPVVKPAFAELSQSHLHPNVGLSIRDILNKLWPVPRKDLLCEMRTIAGRFQAKDQALPILFDIFDEIVNEEGLSADAHNRVVLRVDLPVAIIVEDIQILHCFLRVTAPSLQSNQQLFDVRITVGEIKQGYQILHLETSLNDVSHLLLVPFLEVYSLEFLCLFGYLLENGCVVVKRSVDIMEMLEPQ